MEATGFCDNYVTQQNFYSEVVADSLAEAHILVAADLASQGCEFAMPSSYLSSSLQGSASEGEVGGVSIHMSSGSPYLSVDPLTGEAVVGGGLLSSTVSSCSVEGLTAPEVGQVFAWGFFAVVGFWAMGLVVGAVRDMIRKV